jgi:hypothetical protein
MDFAYHCIRGLSNQKKRALSFHKGSTFTVVEKNWGGHLPLVTPRVLPPLTGNQARS